MRHLLLLVASASVLLALALAGCRESSEKLTDEQHANPPGKVGMEMGPKGPQ